MLKNKQNKEKFQKKWAIKNIRIGFIKICRAMRKKMGSQEWFCQRFQRINSLKKK